MSREQWDALVDANEAHTLTLTLAQRNVIAGTAAYLEATEKQNEALKAELTARDELAEKQATILPDIRSKIEQETTPGEWTAYIYEQLGLLLRAEQGRAE